MTSSPISVPYFRANMDHLLSKITETSIPLSLHFNGITFKLTVDKDNPDQIEHWARIGKCAEENPDLTYSQIKEILTGISELEDGQYSEYKFG